MEKNYGEWRSVYVKVRGGEDCFWRWGKCFGGVGCEFVRCREEKERGEGDMIKKLGEGRGKKGVVGEDGRKDGDGDRIGGSKKG